MSWFIGELSGYRSKDGFVLDCEPVGTVRAG